MEEQTISSNTESKSAIERNTDDGSPQQNFNHGEGSPGNEGKQNTNDSDTIQSQEGIKILFDKYHPEDGHVQDHSE